MTSPHTTSSTNPAKVERVLVTGATGMTGHAIVRQLLASRPHVLVRATYHTLEPDWQDDRVEWIKADLRTREGCVLAAQGCTHAALSAASTGGAAAAGSMPHRQMTDNIVMDSYLLEAAQAAGIGRVVYLSSATVYQEFNGYIAEDQLDFNAEPHAAYLGVGWAKRAAEKFCRFWHEKHGVTFAILRCANIYGPRAKFDPASSNFIPALIRKAVDRLEPFEVWGSPDVQRDIVYVDDVGSAVDLALSSDAPFEVYNMGSNQTVRVEDAVRYALAAAGHQPGEIRYRQDRPSTISFRGLDCQKLREKLGWAASTTPQQGIHLTTSWWTQNMHRWKR